MKLNFRTMTLPSGKPFFDLLENVHLIAVLINTKGIVTFCNDYLVNITGYTKEEIIGSNWFELMIPEIDQDTKELFLSALKNGSIDLHYENPIMTRSGKLLQIFWNNTVLKDDNGSIIGTASIGEDVTEQKRTREILVATNKKLEEAEQYAMMGSWEYNFQTGEGWWSKQCIKC